MGRDCASECVPIALAVGRPEDPSAHPSYGPHAPSVSTSPKTTALLVLSRPAHGPETLNHGGVEPDQFFAALVGFVLVPPEPRG